MKITATNKATGEVIDLPAGTPEEVVQAWQIAQQYSKAAEELKDQLKQIVPSLVNAKGQSDPVNGYAFRVSAIQRTTYDKSVMREVLDADVFDVLLMPDKGAVDKYLKENLETLGDASTRLRSTMIPSGRPYQVIKLEKVSRDND